MQQVVLGLTAAFVYGKKKSENMKSLWSELEEYAESGIYPMHMPGHKRNIEMFSNKNPYEMDITEIDGFDDLQDSRGIILQAKERAARLYGAEESYLLVNGSTVGILAGISAGLRKGDRILMARNCHKSVYNAVFLKEAKPVYLYPDYLDGFSMYGSISPRSVKDSLETYPDIRMVVLVSPTYEGIVSDIAAIAEEVHHKGIPLFVDEAHGAHFGFHDSFPKSAVTLGADLVVQSVHKTLPGFTQSALLHRVGNRINAVRLQQYLNRYQSSSPSYLLMAGIDRSMVLLDNNAEKLMKNYRKKLSNFYEETQKLQHLQVLFLTKEEKKVHSVYDWDCSKLIIYTKHTNLTGVLLAEHLLKDYRIQMEMVCKDYVLGMTSICDTEEGFLCLLHALEEIDHNCLYQEDMDNMLEGGKKLPEQVYIPSETEDFEPIYMKLEECEGKITLEYLYLYPPGSPFLVPGERISKESIEQIRLYQQTGLAVHGLDSQSRIRVAKERK